MFYINPNCLSCGKPLDPGGDPASPSYEEVVLFLRDHAHTRNWQEFATKLLNRYTLTKKENT